MQILELVTDNGLTQIACRCQPRPTRKPATAPAQTFTIAAGARVFVRCPSCRETVDFDLPCRTQVPVESLDPGDAPEQISPANSFVFLRSGGFTLNVIDWPKRIRCCCPRCAN